MKPAIDLQIASLLDAYRTQRLTPREVIDALWRSIDWAAAHQMWITRLSREQVMTYVQALDGRDIESLPLYGVPFAIKDNIDLAGIATTAGCAAYASVPAQSASVVQRLLDAGAIPIGKTNLDQFATGLVGVRSPYGACRNSFDPAYIAGGSSSGSAVAVAMGLVSFALGTDTAGSGRVPAAFNNIVGLKPTCGSLSTNGVVPACRSLDAVSIFALSSHDAASVMDVARGFDPQDPYSRALELVARPLPANLRVGIPRLEQLEFFGDEGYAAQFAQACARCESLGATAVEVDFTPFLEAARLLYEGPWVAERYAAISRILDEQPAALQPITREIITGGTKLRAVDAFRAMYRLKELQRATSGVWRDIDMLLTPTTGTIYTIADVIADPFELNTNLGFYTNFVNLLDLAAVAVPAGFRPDGLPFGVTVSAPATQERMLLEFTARFHHASVATLGALDTQVPAPRPFAIASTDIAVVVCGAHLSGLPFNHQLTDRNARLLRATKTAPHYRFYALPGDPPKRPGLVRVSAGGAAIDVEVWSMPHEHFGSFVAGIPAPLGIGKVALADGSVASGFLCEAYALEGAQEITDLAGWRKYLESQAG